jgi:hypothetical protein
MNDFSKSALVREDLEHAIGQLNNYPPEQRTLTLIICLMRNSYARSTLKAFAGMT